MAKSLYQIQMDYNNAVRQANSLIEIANDLRRTANSGLQDCVSQISGSWTGTNAKAYVGKCDALKEKILQSASKLQRTAEVIKQIAKSTYDAEMRAREIMLRREY